MASPAAHLFSYAQSLSWIQRSFVEPRTGR